MGGKGMADVDSSVKEAVVEALALDDDEVTPESTLMDDLGAESIDLLDILFRVEKSTGVKIEASDLGDYIQGGIPDDVFSDENEIITAEGAAQLHKAMPQVDPAELEGTLKADEVITLFTVQNLVDMVKARADGDAG
jgi:acyl carrier protein